MKLEIGHLYVIADPAVDGRRYWLIGWRTTNHAGGYTLREIIASGWRELVFYATGAAAAFRASYDKERP